MECSFSAGDFKYTRASREKPAEKEKESEELLRKEGLFQVQRMDALGSFNGFQAMNDISRLKNAPHHSKDFPC